jgi:hypothetical protein
MNSLIELHDSRIAEVTNDAGVLTVRFSPAYLHKSDGQPGVDPGTGWTQDIAFVIREASLRGALPMLPCDVSDGELTVAGQSHTNAIPLPLDTPAAVELSILFVAGAEVTIMGRGARVELLARRSMSKTSPEARGPSNPRLERTGARPAHLGRALVGAGRSTAGR